MKTITVNGGRALFGTVSVQGSKNAALPIIFATLITHGVSAIKHFPDIGDTRVAIRIIERLGARVKLLSGTLYVDTRSLSYSEPDQSDLCKIRASTYLLGSMLSRFGRCTISSFGGCAFSARPIDMHIDACIAFGANQFGEALIAKELIPTEISFKKCSVGATINALILAAATEGVSVIRGYAKEPHVLSLIDFLRSAGGKITVDNEKITVVGGELHGGEVSVIGDMIEAGSYLTAGLVSGGCVSVRGAEREHLDSYLKALAELGVENSFSGDSISTSLTNFTNPVNIIAEPYPAFATDLQPIIAPLLSLSSGGSITDKVWGGRYGYLSTLSEFGLKYKVENGTAYIEKSEIHPASVIAPDLRGGMAALLLALSAEGVSKISRAEQILRGYENLIYKLRTVGADVSID